MKADGFSLDDKRTPVTENDIPDIIERFKTLIKKQNGNEQTSHLWYRKRYCGK